jgi:hypothetical protein
MDEFVNFWVSKITPLTNKVLLTMEILSFFSQIEPKLADLTQSG